MTGDLPHPIFSRFYSRMSRTMQTEGMAELRAELLATATGTVAEIGCGNGLNFGYYPASVTEVIAVEPEPRLRRLAGRAADEAPISIDVRAGTASALPLAGDSADTAVLCLVLCAIADKQAALGEVRRVLRPAGRLLFLEHTLAQGRRLRTVQRVVDATIWPLLTGGCHTATDPASEITAAGLTVESVRRLDFPEGRVRVPASPHVLGIATAQVAERPTEE